MRQIRPRGAPALVCALAAALSACQQSDQELPFELDGGAGQTASIGTNGGLISVPPSFSMQFPAGSLAGATQITAATRLTAFPLTAGLVVPGTTFDVGPAGTQLLLPARVQIAVPASLLGAGQDLRLAVGLLRPGGSVVTDVTSYDAANGILTADLDEVGPVAAVIVLDAIPIQNLASIPGLGGGSIAPPSPAPQPAGPALSSHGGVEFTAFCAGDDRNCFTSGIVQIWADQVVRDRLGSDMVLLNTTVTASLDFLAFDLFGRPTQVVGYIDIDGDLRARINSVVSSRSLGEALVLHTGAGSSPSPTTVTFNGNVVTLAETSEGPNEMLDFAVTGIGTGEQITLRLEGELEFTNASPQPPSYGQIVAHVRLRR
ncbi:MAG: hypothetical protein OEM67_10860 [Thermoleophilia bacterium]|nr:hypothetical protein [Thermoleophilia bacterium]